LSRESRERESSPFSACTIRSHSSPCDACNADASMPPHDRENVVEPLGQDNVGRQMLLKMGWAQDTGLGPKGNGRREPITDHAKIGQKLYAHEEDAGGARLGVAVVSELYRLEQTSKADWKNGSSDWNRWEDLTAHFDRAGILADNKNAVSVRPESTPAYCESVDAWSDEIFLEHSSTGVKVKCTSEIVAQRLKDRWADEEKLDKVSISADHFFACCKVAQAPIQLLCIETTGETYECIVKAPTGRELKQILQHKLQGSVRVLGPRHVCDVACGEDGQRKAIRQDAAAVPAACDFTDSGGEDGNPCDDPLLRAHCMPDDIVGGGPPPKCEIDGGISAQSLEVLSREFQSPPRSSDEESLSSRVTETSVNPGHHACERLVERGISDKHIRLAKKAGRLVISIEQKRGGDPEFTTYQLTCKREALRELGKRLTNRFSNIVANEPVEKGRGRGVHRRLEMRLDGSEGLGPDVKKLLDEEHQGFGTLRKCARCEDVHIIRLKFVHEISENNTLVVVEGRQSIGAVHRSRQRQTPISAWGIVTTYFHNCREKQAHGEGETVSRHLSLFGITRKTMGADPGESERNLQASRLLGCDVFGRVYLVCRSTSRVHAYFLTDFIRDFPEGP